jgi:hypothetical protein
MLAMVAAEELEEEAAEDVLDEEEETFEVCDEGWLSLDIVSKEHEDKARKTRNEKTRDFFIANSINY